MSQPTTEFWQDFLQQAAKCDVEAALAANPGASKPGLAYAMSGAMLGGAVATGILAYARRKHINDYDPDNDSETDSTLQQQQPSAEEKQPDDPPTPDVAAEKNETEVTAAKAVAVPPATDESTEVVAVDGILRLQTEEELEAAGNAGPGMIQRATDLLKSFVWLAPAPAKEPEPLTADCAESMILVPLPNPEDAAPGAETAGEDQVPTKPASRWFF